LIAELDDSFPVFGLARERLVPGKSYVSFRLSAGFHAVPANAGYVSIAVVEVEPGLCSIAARLGH
jgi:hypothetical protein